MWLVHYPRQYHCGAMTARLTSPSTEQVISHVRDLIGRGHLRTGDRLPPSATWSRNSASAVPPFAPRCARWRRWASSKPGMVREHTSRAVRRNSTARHSVFSRRFTGLPAIEMFEARRVLEVSAAGLAAERATGNDLAAIAEEVASLFASMDDPELFLVHDMQFHRAVAAACGIRSWRR